jgi:hypothetical protein
MFGLIQEMSVSWYVLDHNTRTLQAPNSIGSNDPDLNGRQPAAPSWSQPGTARQTSIVAWPPSARSVRSRYVILLIDNSEDAFDSEYVARIVAPRGVPRFRSGGLSPGRREAARCPVSQPSACARRSAFHRGRGTHRLPHYCQLGTLASLRTAGQRDQVQPAVTHS